MKAPRNTLSTLASLLGVTAMLIAGGAQAQLYKWVGPDGKVTYSDTPPPKTAAKVEKKSLGSSGPSDAGLPYEVANAMRNNPVVIYTMAKCAGCDAARNALQQRGVPYSEKTVSGYEDQNKLLQVSGGTELPFITVGRTQIKGYDQSAISAALSAAGYPENSVLPRSYQFRAAESAAPPAPKAEPKASPTPTPTPSPTPAPRPANDNTPPGFQF